MSGFPKQNAIIRWLRRSKLYIKWDLLQLYGVSISCWSRSWSSCWSSINNIATVNIKQSLSKHPLKFRGLCPTWLFWGFCLQGVMYGVGKNSAGGFVRRGLSISFKTPPEIRCPTWLFWGFCPQGVMSGVGKNSTGGFVRRGLCPYT